MLLALSFFAVGSGPEGGEAVIIAAGPLIGLLSLVVFPVVYFFPMAFMVTELVGAIPEAGGHAYWVALAFGPAWGLQAGFWAWVGNCMHCATYASLGVNAIYRAAGWENLPVLEYTMRAGISMLLAMPSFFQLRRVSYGAVWLMAFILIPYVVIAVWSSVRAESWDKLGTVPAITIKSENSQLGYGNLVGALAWNFNGYQNISVFAKCVHDPPRTFRRVMLISFGLIPLSYLVPILPVIALCEPDWTTWTGTGSAIYSAGKYLGGSTYTVWITVVSLICDGALYIGGLLCSVFLACGMAEKDFAPFSLRFSGMTEPTVHGIDHSVIFCSIAITLIVVTISITDMVMISNALSGLETMVLIVAAVRLRVTMPDLPRSTYLCGNSYIVLMAAVLVVPFTVSGYVVGWAFTKLIPAALTGVFIFSGIIYSLQSDLKNFRYTYEPVRTTETT
ncbi:Amino Acid-Polyamine-Organocation (APC) protein [Phytophthora megakarya]|uniref:Amino Acid-Polyamine-Organocation (APC) protein n=1 Tax=Phytophthora megakarya TaxID=4795 RepID=A0A225VHY5_9STRA|nr:Amino Acid-Polyamine-Organocation (APC) protein [Phytophthora megakarya]